MPGSNDFLNFCSTDTGTNVESQAAYLADANRPIGNQPGIADPKFVNKAMRQASYIISQLTQFLVNRTGLSATDSDGAIAGNGVLNLLNIALKTAPTITKFTAGAGLYVPPANCLWLRVRLVGGGGGGSGSATDGGNGGDTTFGVLTGSGAHGPAFGAANLGGAIGLALPGRSGAPGLQVHMGGAGAATPFGDGGSAANSDGAWLAPSTAPVANTGAGGGGSTAVAAGSGLSGGGGGFVDALIIGPLAANYAYSVGAAGAQGFTCLNGSAGAAGQIEIEEHYN